MLPPSFPLRFRNSILASLPEEEIGKLRPHLSPVTLRRHQTLHNAGEPVDTVYFLEQGICSIVSTLRNGTSVEVGLIGRDGFVGFPVALGTCYSLNRSFIQLAGSGYKIKAKTLESHCSDDSSELRKCLLRAIQGLLLQTAQTAACNRVHQLEERLCRWLLMCHDRMQTDFLLITHEFLAIMLGTRRSSVTVAAGILQEAGLIEYTRGKVQILNRAGLEGEACECYLVVHNEFVRLGLLQ